ncbi:MAG: FIST C-terminal domain-containing protein [Frankiaceae bacterium]|nr:FIST C-terminal domain-containing protein [Frankiaceae bacterium]
MAHIADGLALDADLLVAAEQASRQAMSGFGARRPDLVCAFVSGGDPDQVAAAGERVAAMTGAQAMVGCSAGGVIGGRRGVEDRAAVSVWAARLPGATVRSFHLEVMRADEGMAVVGMPERTAQENVAVLLADPYSFPADGFVSRANDALTGLAIVGGMAHGPVGAGSTRLWVDGRTHDRGAVGVLVGGAGVVATPVVSQGCRPVGPAMTVTAATGNVIAELAGVRALQKVEEILAGLPPAEQALASSGLQLGIALNEYAEEHDRGDFLIRPLLGLDPDSSGLVIGDLVEVGSTVRLQVRDAEGADEDLCALLGNYRGSHPAVAGALLFSCNGRGGHLFGSSLGGADHDVTVVRRELRTDGGIAGFFAAGELGPVAGRNHLHGFTASVLAFPA